MGSVLYTALGEEIVSEDRDGVEHDYVSDAIGSTVALLNSTQTQTDSFSYWPYGETASRTGTTTTPLQFVGARGYYRDGDARHYVRRRVFRSDTTRWQTRDPFGLNGGDTNLYRYVFGNPTTYVDPNGTQLEICLQEGIVLRPCPIEVFEPAPIEVIKPAPAPFSPAWPGIQPFPFIFPLPDPYERYEKTCCGWYWCTNGKPCCWGLKCCYKACTFFLEDTVKSTGCPPHDRIEPRDHSPWRGPFNMDCAPSPQVTGYFCFGWTDLGQYPSEPSESPPPIIA